MPNSNLTVVSTCYPATFPSKLLLWFKPLLPLGTHLPNIPARNSLTQYSHQALNFYPTAQSYLVMAATVLITLNSATNPLIFIIRRYSVLYSLYAGIVYFLTYPLINFIINPSSSTPSSTSSATSSSTTSSTPHQLHHQPPHQLHHQPLIINPSSTSSSTPHQLHHQPLINPSSTPSSTSSYMKKNLCFLI